MEDPAGQISPFAYLFAAFTFWMLFDAWKRRAPLHWFFIIVVMPFGAVFYFVMIKLRDMRGGAARPTSGLESVLRAASIPIAAGTPSELDRADALEAAERYAEAEPLYRAVLAEDDSNLRALIGLARCLTGQGNAKEALPHYERLLELDRSYANYGGALEFADALWAADQRSDTIELLENLAAMTGRLNHRLAYAHYLAEFGRTQRAIEELERALNDATIKEAPSTDQQRRWVERGQRMLETLSAQARSHTSSSDPN
jgi:hypothetical protein